MKNLLLNHHGFSYEFNWGTVIAPFISAAKPFLVERSITNTVYLKTSAQGPYTGYVNGTNSIMVPYAHGMIITKRTFGYGTFTLKCKLPNFRGSWPAFWLLNANEKNILPELDWEQFRKNGFLSRFKITASYHDGPSYDKGKSVSKTVWRLRPYDYGTITLQIKWTPFEIGYIADGKTVLTIRKEDYPNFPVSPMNIIVNSCVGDWKPDEKHFEPFVLYSLTHEPL